MTRPQKAADEIVALLIAAVIPERDGALRNELSFTFLTDLRVVPQTLTPLFRASGAWKLICPPGVSAAALEVLEKHAALLQGQYDLA